MKSRNGGKVSHLLGLALLFFTPSSGAFHFFDPANRSEVPALLSQTGIYSDISAKVTDTALKYFEINSALWSDGAAKKRWVILPPGRQIPYVDSTDLFAYPDSTVFVKAFLLERVEGDPGSLMYWETRLLMNRKDSEGKNTWYGFSYRWNAEATEAALVDPDAGLDTVFFYHPNGPAGPQSYKKWRYPNQFECAVCHASRHVLGFLPAQLKRPAPSQPSLNQVQALFNQGVFSGTVPDAERLSRRWKGMHEPISPGLTPEERFKVIDTLARSYIGANCSGCHGDRGLADAVAPAHANFDFHKLTPAMAFANVATNTLDLESEDDTRPHLLGRRYYIEAAVQAGLDTSAGAPWNMARPAEPAEPNLLYPGHPSFSTLLFRQMLRRGAWRDSSLTRQYLLDSGDPDGWMAWIFSQPWGSQAWRDQMAAKNVSLDAVILHQKEVPGAQMPPLASSYIPDVDALRVLGEWVKTYRPIHAVDTATNIDRSRKGSQATAALPVIRGRLLVFPDAWSGDVGMTDIRGRKAMLRTMGAGRFAIPPSVSPGVYFFQAGTRRFKASVLD